MMAVDDGHFRQAMRRVAATVCVLSAQTPHGRRGVTVSSVASLTIEPPTICFSLHKLSSFYSAVLAPRLVCVNVLARGQDEIGAAFAASNATQDRFAIGVWDTLDVTQSCASGERKVLPILRGAQANIVAEICHDVAYGTHHLCIAEVREVRMAECVDPLIYCNGNYRALAAAES